MARWRLVCDIPLNRFLRSVERGSTDGCLCSFVCLVKLSLCLSVVLVVCFFLCSFVSLVVFLFVCLSVCLSVGLSVCLLSVWLIRWLIVWLIARLLDCSSFSVCTCVFCFVCVTVTTSVSVYPWVIQHLVSWMRKTLCLMTHDWFLKVVGCQKMKTWVFVMKVYLILWNLQWSCTACNRQCFEITTSCFNLKVRIGHYSSSPFRTNTGSTFQNRFAMVCVCLETLFLNRVKAKKVCQAQQGHHFRSS